MLVPIFQLLHAVFELASVRRWSGGEAAADANEAFFTAFEMRGHLFTEQAGEEVAQLGFGYEMLAAIIRDGAGSDCAKRAQELESLAGGTFADREAPDHIIQGERFRRDEEQAEDLADRLRRTEQPPKPNKDLDDLSFHLRQIFRVGRNGVRDSACEMHPPGECEWEAVGSRKNEHERVIVCWRC